jgi:hypothetical protein
LIKGLSPTSGPLIVLFSSYGSPSAKPLGDIYTPTPIYFQPDQRVSLRRSTRNSNLALLFSPIEFNDVVARVSQFYSQHGQAFHLCIARANRLCMGAHQWTSSRSTGCPGTTGFFGGSYQLPPNFYSCNTYQISNLVVEAIPEDIFCNTSRRRARLSSK